MCLSGFTCCCLTHCCVQDTHCFCPCWDIWCFCPCVYSQDPCPLLLLTPQAWGTHTPGLPPVANAVIHPYQRHEHLAPRPYSTHTHKVKSEITDLRKTLTKRWQVWQSDIGLGRIKVLTGTGWGLAPPIPAPTYDLCPPTLSVRFCIVHRSLHIPSPSHSSYFPFLPVTKSTIAFPKTIPVVS